MRRFRAWLLHTVGALLAAIVPPPAFAFSEHDLQVRYCGGAGMETNVRMPDGTYVDCLSPTHAIEVDFSDRWSNAIGQALHYSLWTQEFSDYPDDFARWHLQVKTPRRAGIIFACKANRRTETCANHIVRPQGIAEAFGVPLTIWGCNPDKDATLEECQRIDVDPPATQ